LYEAVAGSGVRAGAGRRWLVWGLVFLCSLCVAALVTLSPGSDEAGAQSYGVGTVPEAADIPPEYLREYQEAGAAYGLDWTILAAIGKVESGHGAGGLYGCILGPPTPYGPAYGPMQFLVSSWAALGVDGNGDGIVDSCNYRDAIPSAANYLVQSGAPADYYRAIYSYNHADWYVQSVLAQARTYYQVYVTGAY